MAVLMVLGDVWRIGVSARVSGSVIDLRWDDLR